jgi:hypothetical protein
MRGRKKAQEEFLIFSKQLFGAMIVFILFDFSIQPFAPLPFACRVD